MKNGLASDMFDEVTQMYQSKFFAFTTSLLAFFSHLHSWRGWRVQFNAEPNYPQIVGIIGEVSLPKTEARPQGPQTQTHAVR